MDCIFCKIIDKKMPADIVYESDKIIAIKDINPRAPVHFLIIPKKHIPSVNHVKIKDKDIMGDLVLAAQKMAREKKLKGYKLLINVGREGGQIIDHLHLHLLSRKPT
jgi:histidine triad (HIT) family protein